MLSAIYLTILIFSWKNPLKKLFFLTVSNTITNQYFTFTFDIVPSILSFDIQKVKTTSFLASWDSVNTSIVDNYTVTVTRLCDNVSLSPVNVIDGKLSSILIDGLLSGSQYRVSLIPTNILGEGMEITEDVTIDQKGIMF